MVASNRPASSVVSVVLGRRASCHYALASQQLGPSCRAEYQTHSQRSLRPSLLNSGTTLQSPRTPVAASTGGPSFVGARALLVLRERVLAWRVAPLCISRLLSQRRSTQASATSINPLPRAVDAASLFTQFTSQYAKFRCEVTARPCKGIGRRSQWIRERARGHPPAPPRLRCSTDA